MVKTLNIVKKLSLIYIALVILYYLPLINTFTQILMKLTPFALYIYWTILTLICIVVGAKYLDKMLGE
ncbi:hypothetical protein Igag_0575 [Ignisphaera aggregans DSM 17230]|uniref:Uncharacterized protein n=1 Tax=Ignisphaera aggregans (strain DSM 17230 / JCM 13409 / AQ1.S1) TaxID=583356 RepID=E0SSD8_IGNAA|nr:hypothetical protein Igag_0575 [Ignisphaera aggregans DSM 17230]